MLVLLVSSIVDVTVKEVEVLWSAVSVEVTVMTRPLMEIHAAEGDIVRISVKVQSVPWVYAGTVHV